jgi:hypothetical protein
MSMRHIPVHATWAWTWKFSLDKGIQYGHDVDMEMRMDMNMQLRMDMQHRHGHEACAWPCSMGMHMQHGMSLQHRHGQGHAAWTWTGRLGMDGFLCLVTLGLFSGLLSWREKHGSVIPLSWSPQGHRCSQGKTGSKGPVVERKDFFFEHRM